MVLVRTFLNARTLTLPRTRQLLPRWRPHVFARFCPGSSNLCNSSVGDDLRLFQAFSKSSKLESGARVSRKGQEVPRTRVQCLGAFASSKEFTIRFPVSLDENTSVDSNVKASMEQLEIDGPLAVKLAVESFEGAKKADIVELSLLLCDDEFIQNLNSKWLGKDAPTDVLSFPQDQGPHLIPHLLLGDIIISLETAAKQAEERGHSLLDELRILLVHGLLHLLGYDHEIGPEASEQMEEKETEILSTLGWKGKGLINASLQASSEDLDLVTSNGASKSSGEGAVESIRKPDSKPPFKILFCDMDGTLLNGQSRVTEATADALQAAVAKGVQVIIATGKTQHGAIAALKPVGLTGKGGIISPTSPGVFTQGLQVYGRGGSMLCTAVLHPDIVREAFLYSLEHTLPTLGFSGNRIVTLFRSPLTDMLHTVYLEPEAEVIPSVHDLMAACPIQKILFYETAESIKQKIRPYWTTQTQGRAALVQASEEMLEMLPLNQSKGAGVKMLLDHLGVSPEEVMAIGDGENDIEMLQLAGWGVAMANGSERTKSVANALTGHNNEDGAAQAIHRYILS